jgi:hypothetical protein
MAILWLAGCTELYALQGGLQERARQNRITLLQWYASVFYEKIQTE